MLTKTIPTITLFVYSFFMQIPLNNGITTQVEETTAIHHFEDVGIQFNNELSFNEVKEMAQQSGKNIFIDFYATWCGPCKRMESEVFSNSSVGSYMNNYFINYKVSLNSRSGKNLAYKYKVNHLPALLIVTPEGDVLSKEAGFLDKDEFLSFVKETRQS